MVWSGLQMWTGYHPVLALHISPGKWPGADRNAMCGGHTLRALVRPGTFISEAAVRVLYRWQKRSWSVHLSRSRTRLGGYALRLFVDIALIGWAVYFFSQAQFHHVDTKGNALLMKPR
ncbi:hypothetical protein DL89DRAFT_11232 [Linderina pennispora]|uniref:Uncharacterized protein n=1 Tax=Linderina pennispora TaxID=61395 RepID=A0A1Y1WL11_9FUNG|nr:uncharacterized protein DL89DRAFT_11232 [Linderina pennispora]ORX74172.1 hypothetical protein DL89DRAFT_11232 [Linderina pennispora]